ncbi:SusC/RagA family TonB-linked outer membrane protein [Dinghuibacter silviterrae]|uniref:TonB-linked SusC/RagA family outer membrane protein n=1 Tax=Dinghuibacter silviterrae TaxID=1539049 RepID=A0A4R8DMD2_9BACT|nr:SusC/RagA family TonB-linked outer membrane protein [Dinghuibacter silviterrae]TDW99139.1 TonB-linked SusC/RagA family outer membrane protein [Dinghuibacter silviterrae]
MRKFLLLLGAICLLCSVLYGQALVTVKGRVLDDKGQPVPFASIKLRHGKTGVAADKDGNFTISAPKGEALLITGVGIAPSQYTVTGTTGAAVITVARETSSLSDIVVTAMGIKRQPKEIGYSTATVGAKDLNVGSPVDLQSGLTGRVAGLQITEVNNSVNPDFRIILRGERHITADNQALIVLDGVIVTADILGSLNPQDVENVTVLKGASASALYGSEASNGVVIITTKHGSPDGKPRITFSSTVQAQHLSYYPKLQNQFGGYGGEASVWYGGPNGTFYWAVNPLTNMTQMVPYENESYGPPFNGALYVMGGPDAAGQYLKLPYSAASKPPLLAFTKTGVTTQNNISYSGGDAKNNYFISAQDVETSGVVPKDKSRRDNLRFANMRTFGKFWAQYDLNFSEVYSNTVGGDPISGNPIFWNLLNLPVNLPINDFKNWQTNPFANPFEAWPNSYYTNPWYQIDASRVITKTDRITGNVALGLDILPWLKVSYGLGATIDWENGKNTVAGYTVPAYYATPAGLGPWGSFANTATTPFKNGSLTDYIQYRRRLQQDIKVNFNKNFGRFSINAYVGNTIWDRYQSNQSDASSQAFIPGFYNISYTLGSPTVAQSISESRLIGVFGDLTLGWGGYLFLHGSLRNDWTSLLSAGKNSYLYPAVDGSFIFTEAFPTLKSSLPWLSSGKIRANYSVTGEVSVGPYSISSTFTVPGNFPYGNLAGLQNSNLLGNPDLVPEKSADEGVGLDLGFWNNRINVVADYYHTLTRNQTFPVGLAQETGFTKAYVNGGEMLSQGEEVSVNISPLVTGRQGLRWDIGANVSFNQSKVLSLYGGGKQFQIQDNSGNSTTSYAVVGQPYPVIEAADFLRDPKNGKILVNTQGMPEESPNLVIAGRSTPAYILGITTSLSYRHFTLSLVADYRGGYNVVEAIGGSLDFTGVGVGSTQAGRQRFIFPNSEIDEGNGKYVPNTYLSVADGNYGLWVGNPNYAYASGLYGYTAHTNFVVSAAAWKLRTASLSYDFSHFVSTHTSFIRGGTFALVGYNLLMFVPKQNIYGDPEFNADNSNASGYTDQNQFPATRNFGATLTVNF